VIERVRAQAPRAVATELYGSELRGREPLEWQSLFGAFRDTLEWVLDLSAEVARNFPDEVAAVERVRTFMRRELAGVPAHLRIEDLLFTFALMLVAVERRRSSLRS